jgi:eukaryotic-like serine/threonine-protein kinase
VIGTTLSHYQVVAKIGEGGMGAVYRALDTRLNRPVALKVLAPAVMRDENNRARFAAEARAASALNHPNIITVYDVGESGGVSFIAMEFVDGSSLDRLIGRKGLSLRDALAYGVQVADALATAHAAGIIHRDVKPANVMVTHQGRVKILDFGIAKLIEPAAADDSAITGTSSLNEAPRTEEGTIIGTAAYMSPEQAEGRKLDRRSDIFSFGSLLYEMVTGKRAFQGDTRASTLSAILQREPRPASEIAPGVPRELERIIAHCLRKDPIRRFQHLDDVKTLLEELKEESDSGSLFAQEAGRSVSATWSRRAALVGGVALVTVAALGAILWSRRSVRPPKEPIPIRLTSDAGLSTDPALSADGKLLAFASDRAGGDNLDIWVKQVGGSEALRLTTNEADDSQPDLSPDGQRIAFRSERGGGGIFVVSTLGGDARLIAAAGRRPRFSPDGDWLAYWVGGIGADFIASGGSSVCIVPSRGGAARTLTSNLVSARHPVWSPDGSRLLVYGAGKNKRAVNENADWWVVPLGGGPAIKTGAFDVFRRQKLSAAFDAVPSAWTSDNHIVFSSTFGDSTNVWQVPISSDAYQIFDPVQRLTSGTGLEGFPAIANGRDGTLRLVFASMNENIDVWSLRFTANGGANQGRVAGEMQRLTQDAAPDVQPALSRDGQLLVFASSRLGNQDIWMKDLGTGRETALANTSLAEWHPVISADGSTVAYQVIESEKETIHAVVRGNQPMKICGDCYLPWDLSSDGTKMLYWSTDQRRIGLIDMASGARSDLLSDPKYALLHAKFSPDDSWIVFHAIDHSGPAFNFIAPFSGKTPPAERE